VRILQPDEAATPEGRRALHGGPQDLHMVPFRRPRGVPESSRPWRLLLIAGVILALYLGRDLLAPLALALLLTVAALPLVSWLERRRVPRVLAVLLVLLLFVTIIVLLVFVVVGQALALANQLPLYESVLREKLVAVSEGSGPIERVMQLVRRLSASVTTTNEPSAATVVLAATPEGPLSNLVALGALVMAPVATLAITLLLMGFILVQREDVRDRALRLVGLHEMHRTTLAMADATSRVGRFLLMQAMMNGIFGASMGVGLWLIGIPNAPLWGVLGFALRFVPYLGAPLSALFPLLVAVATTEGWTTVLMVLALFIAVDVVITYGLEPWLYGVSIGITPLALVLSSAFWAVLWGPVGLMLAPAFSAVMVIIGRHVPALGFLEVLLGDKPPLPAPARFYQRLLAGDVLSGTHILAVEFERSGVRPALEQVVLPAIAQVGNTRAQDSFGPALALRAARTLLRVLEAVVEPLDDNAEIAVLPVGGALDRAAAATVVVALQDAGLPAVLSPTTASAYLVAILVAADPPSAHRLARALREAHQTADVVRLFSATEEAGLAVAQRAGQVARISSLAALLPDIATLLENALAHHE